MNFLEDIMMKLTGEADKENTNWNPKSDITIKAVDDFINNYNSILDSDEFKNLSTSGKMKFRQNAREQFNALHSDIEEANRIEADEMKMLEDRAWAEGKEADKKSRSERGFVRNSINDLLSGAMRHNAGTFASGMGYMDNLIGEMIGSDEWKRSAQGWMEKAQDIEDNARALTGPGVDSIGEIKSFSDAIDYVGSTVADTAANVYSLPMLAGGAAAKGLGIVQKGEAMMRVASAGLGSALKSGMYKEAAKMAAKWIGGQTLKGLPTYFAMSVPELYREQWVAKNSDENGNFLGTDKLPTLGECISTAFLAVPHAWIEQLGVDPAKVADIPVKKAAKQFFKDLLKEAIGEGTEEVLQDPISKFNSNIATKPLGEAFTDTIKWLCSKEGFLDELNSFAGGFIGGGALGLGGSVRARRGPTGYYREGGIKTKADMAAEAKVNTLLQADGLHIDPQAQMAEQMGLINLDPVREAQSRLVDLQITLDEAQKTLDDPKAKVEDKQSAAKIKAYTLHQIEGLQNAIQIQVDAAGGILKNSNGGDVSSMAQEALDTGKSNVDITKNNPLSDVAPATVDGGEPLEEEGDVPSDTLKESYANDPTSIEALNQIYTTQQTGYESFDDFINAVQSGEVTVNEDGTISNSDYSNIANRFRSGMSEDESGQIDILTDLAKKSSDDMRDPQNAQLMDYAQQLLNAPGASDNFKQAVEGILNEKIHRSSQPQQQKQPTAEETRTAKAKEATQEPSGLNPSEKTQKEINRLTNKLKGIDNQLGKKHIKGNKRANLEREKKNLEAKIEKLKKAQEAQGAEEFEREQEAEHKRNREAQLSALRNAFGISREAGEDLVEELERNGVPYEEGVKEEIERLRNPQKAKDKNNIKKSAENAKKAVDTAEKSGTAIKGEKVYKSVDEANTAMQAKNKAEGNLLRKVVKVKGKDGKVGYVVREQKGSLIAKLTKNARTVDGNKATSIVDYANKQLEQRGSKVRFILHEQFEGDVGMEGFVPEGYYDVGENVVHLFRANIGSEKRLRQVMMHELVTHYGVNNVLTESERKELLDKVEKLITEVKNEGGLEAGYRYFQIGETLIRIADQKFDSYEEFLEEVLAVVSEQYADNPGTLSGKWKTFLNHVVSMIKRGLRRMGLEKLAGEVTEDEIVDALRDIRSAIVVQGQLFETDARLGNRTRFATTADGKRIPSSHPLFSLIREDEIKANSEEYFNKYYQNNGKQQAKLTPINDSGITREALDACNKQIAEMVDVMKPFYDKTVNGNRYLPEEVYGASTLFSNASYGMTMENTTICWRTLAYNKFCDRVKKELGRPLTVRESFLVSQKIYDMGTDPQCLYCYVSLDRKAYDEGLLKYIQQRDAALEDYNKNVKDKSLRLPAQAKKKSERAANTAELAKTPLGQVYMRYLNKREDSPDQRARFNQWLDIASKGNRFISGKDLATKDIRTNLTQDKVPEKWKAVCRHIDNIMRDEKLSANQKANQIKAFKNSPQYHVAWNEVQHTEVGQIIDAETYAQAASWQKKEEEYRSYMGELLTTDKKKLNAIMSHYGLRFYSFSEYVGAFIVENMQMVRDAALRGLKGFAYTKKADFARIFAPTGMNFNIGCYGRKDSNGNIVMDESQGANWDEVKALRKQYPGVGAVFVATTEEMVDWALDQDWIDVIIPFHIVRTGDDVAKYYGWTNFKASQEDKQIIVDDKGKESSKTNNIYPHEHMNDKAMFLRIAKERGWDPDPSKSKFTPRFSQWLSHPNYMKLINETRRTAAETPVLKPTFDMGAAKKAFKEFTDVGGYYNNFYKPGYNFDEEAKNVANDIRAGKEPMEVDYGRQDLPIDYFDKMEKKAKDRNKNREHSRKYSLVKDGTFIYDFPTPTTDSRFAETQLRYHEQKIREAYDKLLKQVKDLGFTEDVLDQYFEGDFNNDTMKLGYALSDNDLLLDAMDLRTPYLDWKRAKRYYESAKKNNGRKFSLIKKGSDLYNSLEQEYKDGNVVIAYRAMQKVVDPDGTVHYYPPMSKKVEGKVVPEAKPGEWHIADEAMQFNKHILRMKTVGKNGKYVPAFDKDGNLNDTTGMTLDKDTKGVALYFQLDKGNGDKMWARYNPYWHGSLTPLNDQFESAWKRPELVFMRIAMPKSDVEAETPYRAEYAKNAVGITRWREGPVSKLLSKTKDVRMVALSRYCKILGEVDNKTVAAEMAKIVKRNGLGIPVNTVTPDLRKELEKLGVEMLPPTPGGMDNKEKELFKQGKFKWSLKKKIQLDVRHVSAATLFSGGGLVEAGLAGIIDPKAAMEFEPNIADIYIANNGDHMIIGNVSNHKDMKKLYNQVDGHVEYFHASPVCHNYSRAKAHREETPLDITTARATAEAITKLKPKMFTLENAPEYTNSKALKMITDVLDKMGYQWDIHKFRHDHYYGATKRERIILRAVTQDGVLPLIRPGSNASARTWYEVTKDLLPDLQERAKPFTAKQKARLNNTQIHGIDAMEYARRTNKPIFVTGNGYNKMRASGYDEPAPTVMAQGASEDFIIYPNGQIYEVSMRMLARLMGLPDSYKLPKTKKWAHTVIGNGVPTELTKAIIKPFIEANDPDNDNGPKKKDIRYSFAGQGAVKKPKYVKSWRTAERMLKKGVDAEEVRQKTGWFIGLDGKPRFEIFTYGIKGMKEDGSYDSKVDKIKIKVKSVDEIPENPIPITDVVEFKDLFDAYPQLRNLKINYRDTGEGHGGWYNESQQLINVNKHYPVSMEFLRKTILHELQHAVQAIEGFTNGSNKETEEGKISKESWDKIRDLENTLLSDYRKALEPFKDSKEKARKAWIETAARLEYDVLKKDGLFDYEAKHGFDKLLDEGYKINTDYDSVLSESSVQYYLGKNEELKKASMDMIDAYKKYEAESKRLSNELWDKKHAAQRVASQEIIAEDLDKIYTESFFKELSDLNGQMKADEENYKEQLANFTNAEWLRKSLTKFANDNNISLGRVADILRKISDSEGKISEQKLGHYLAFDARDNEFNEVFALIYGPKSGYIYEKNRINDINNAIEMFKKKSVSEKIDFYGGYSKAMDKVAWERYMHNYGEMEVRQVAWRDEAQRTPYFSSNPNEAYSHDRDIRNVRFSLKKKVEQTKNLLAIHNLHTKELMDSLDLGGFPMPSIAVIRSMPDQTHESYGDISVVFYKDTIDPKKSRLNKVYPVDAWTPTFPDVGYELDWTKHNAMVDRINTSAKKLFDSTTKEDSSIQREYSTSDYIPKNARGLMIEYMENGRSLAALVAAYMNEKNIPLNMDAIRAAVRDSSVKSLYEVFRWHSERVSTVLGDKKEDFTNWLEALLQTNYTGKKVVWTDEFNSSNGKRKLLPFTLENIVKVMKKDAERGGGIYNLTPSHIMAMVAPAFRSVAEIKKASDILGKVENYDEIMRRYGEELREIVTPIIEENQDQGDGNFSVTDDVNSAMLDCLTLPTYSIESFKKMFQRYGMTLSDGNAQAFLDYIQKMKTAQIPTGYFEAKPRRAVPLSEICCVVLPSNVSPEVLRQLEAKKVPYTIYWANNRQSRIDTLNRLESAKFSLTKKKPTSLEKYLSQTKAMRAKLQKAKEEADAADKATLMNKIKAWFRLDPLEYALSHHRRYLEIYEKDRASFFGDEIPEDADPHMMLDTVDGRIQTKRDEFYEDNAQPIIDFLKDHKISGDDFDTYLFARHADERDAQIRKINPELSKNHRGSGWSEEVYAKLGYGKGTPTEVAEALEKKHKDIVTAAKMFWEMNDKLLDVQVEYGLISEETANHMRDVYAHYCPLKRIDDEATFDGIIMHERNGIPSRSDTAKGEPTSVTVATNKRAMGRTSRPEYPLTFALASIDSIFRAGEKNLCHQALWNFALKIHDPQIQLGQQKIIRYIDKQSGEVRYRASTQRLPQTVVARFKGNPCTIHIDNPDLFIAFTSPRSTSGLFAALFKLSNLAVSGLAQNATSRNPEFGFSNMFKDNQQSFMDNIAFKGPKFAWKVIRGWMQAALTFIDYSRGEEWLQKNKDKIPAERVKDVEFFNEYLHNGGSTGYLDVYKLRKKAEDITAEINAVSGSTLWQNIMIGSKTPIKTAQRVLKHGFSKFIKPFEFFNELMEAATRFSNYKQARLAGKSPLRAAEHAKNITLNFNRHGAYWTSEFNWAYMFSNAALQSGFKAIKIWKKLMGTKEGIAGLLSIILLGLFGRIYNKVFSGKDEEDGKLYFDKVPDYKKGSSMIIMVPGGKDYLSLPLQNVLAVPYSIGDNIAAMAMGDKSIPGAVTDSMATILGTLNPFGSDSRFFGTLVPTAVKPLYDCVDNSNFAGSKIHPEILQNVKDIPPKYETHFKNTAQIYIDMSKLLYEGSGKNLDLYPDDIAHLVTSYTGGMTKMLSKYFSYLEKKASGEPTSLSETPFVSRFAGTPDDRDVWEEYLENQALYERIGKGIANRRRPSADELQIFREIKFADQQITNLKKRNQVGKLSDKDYQDKVLLIRKHANRKIRELK